MNMKQAYKEINKYGTIRYFNEVGQKHREDGPAVECADGTKIWYNNGVKIPVPVEKINSESSNIKTIQSLAKLISEASDMKVIAELIKTMTNLQ